MIDKVVVFLGPTLKQCEVLAILPRAIILPPAKRADFLKLLYLKPSVIILVDGCFDQQPSVMHKEILLAMEHGITVFGVSSMGALRAVELQGFGMFGYGKVFQLYQSGEIEDDDEVAVGHLCADKKFLPITDAMINIRFTLCGLLDKGLLGKGEQQLILDKVKELHFKERSFALGLKKCCSITEERKKEISKLYLANFVDQKKLDVLDLLQAIREKSISVELNCRISTERTLYLSKMLRDTIAGFSTSLDNLKSDEGIRNLFVKEKEPNLEKKLQMFPVDLLAIDSDFLPDENLEKAIGFFLKLDLFSKGSIDRLLIIYSAYSKVEVKPKIELKNLLFGRFVKKIFLLNHSDEVAWVLEYFEKNSQLLGLIKELYFILVFIVNSFNTHYLSVPSSVLTFSEMMVVSE
jgi:hypothetical protein